MIDLSKITDADIGRWVEYNLGFKREVGRIKSYNDKYIFIVYHCDDDWEQFSDYTAEATNPMDLRFLHTVLV